MSPFIVVLLVLLLVGAVPAWPHSRRWGYFPSASLGVVVLLLLLLMFTGRI